MIRLSIHILYDIILRTMVFIIIYKNNTDYR